MLKDLTTLPDDTEILFVTSNKANTYRQISFTSNHRILSRLNLLWGVKAFYYDKYVSTDETVDDVNKIAVKRGYVAKGEYLINLAAMPIVDKGMVNTLRVSQV